MLRTIRKVIDSGGAGGFEKSKNKISPGNY